MTPGDGSLNEKLDEMLALSRANNRMLKDMRRDALIGVIVKVVFWGAIFAASYYFTMQYLAPILNSAQSVQGEAANFQQLFEQYRAQFGQ